MLHSTLSGRARWLALPVLILGLAACQTTGKAPAADFPLSDDPLLGKFVWHDLITDDLSSARRFYSGLFGWTFETQERMGENYTVIRSGGYYIGGMVQTDDPNAGDYSRWLGYLSVADVDAAASRTSGAGGEVVVSPLDVTPTVRAAAIRDPQGAVLGLVRSELGDPDDSLDPVAGHVVWNELLASDDSSASAFYAKLAGLDPVTIERRGGEYIMLKADGRERAGVMQRPNDDIEPLWLTYFAVDDPAAATQRAEQLGAEVLLHPSQELREGTVGLVVDPTGAVLALQKWPL